MPIINVATQIDKAKDIEDLRPLLKTLARAINTLADGRHKQVTEDLIVTNEDKGLVLRGDDGRWYRAKIVNDNATVSFSFTDIGDKEPT